MAIGDVIICNDIDLDQIVHDLHKDGWHVHINQEKARRFRISITGKEERKKVKEDEPGD